MYPEDIPQERLERAIKEAKYDKWVNNNQHASNRQKREAKEEFIYCNTFSRPDIKNYGQ